MFSQEPAKTRPEYNIRISVKIREATAGLLWNIGDIRAETFSAGGVLQGEPD